ncbi:isocitrate lyase/PEP mutase family protein [Mesorhizobium sp. ZC-5]|jgi:methylisocitrate lyase|uniref:isocitrate lyase/PEP mutase family protein n=1 Tax=Mesorhizobium sp. ZC-5 TaxID=2986066 RepID=UPI0021E948D3|nr:isocitrate lyase/PEP mutase family protein [Mesorhizobium sp. ZC-5]MCV3243124.1 isocitrate lyase/PEP mutase family protein [Mesorhizobium sp. ZC-5]
METRKKFRRMLSEPGIEIQPAVYDPLSAKLAEKCGFNLLALGGYAMGAHTAITEPLMSLEEVAQITRQVSLVSNLPLMVDAGAGWGDPLHVMHTTKVLERAGAASIHIEDQFYPKRARYHQGVEEVIPVEEMLLKIKAALSARDDPDFAIVVRTDSMRTHGYDEGIRRIREYVKAGADVIKLFPNNEAETIRAPKEVPPIPLVYVNSTGNKFGRGVFTATQLEGWGYKILYDAISTVNVAAQALIRYYTHLRKTGEHGLDDEEIGKVRLQVEQAIGLEEMYRIEEQTLDPLGR